MSAFEKPLNLAGYLPLGDHGFALPCFGTGIRPNIWYLAVCSVPGDHLGKIVQFEPLSSESICVLPEENRRSVEIGEPWCDVFLWDGTCFVGEPAEIWQELAKLRSDITQRAPISLLDLALSVDADDWKKIALKAFSYVSSKYGLAKANNWLCDSLFRQRAKLHLDRLVLVGSIAGPIELARELEVVRVRHDSCKLDVPSILFRQLLATNSLDPLMAQLRELARPFSIDFEAPSNNYPDLPLPAELDVFEEGDRGAAALRLDADRPADVLIVALGKRADEIARHISEPDCWPVSAGEKVPRGRFFIEHLSSEPLPIAFEDGRSRVHVMHGATKLSSLNRYGVIVAIVDDELLLEAALTSTNAILDQVSSHTRVVRIIAPALPRDRPARGTSIEAIWTRRRGGGFSATLDTSVARSPFWSGNPRRALDRRIADVIVEAAILSAYKSPLSQFLKRKNRVVSPPVLALALEGVSSPLTRNVRPLSALRGTMSEVTWRERSSNREKRPLFSANYSMFFERSEVLRSGIVEVREAGTNFQAFAVSVLANIVGLPSGLTAKRVCEIPTPLAEALAFREYSCGIAAQQGDKIKGTAIVAETPDLATIRVAADEGWNVVRYTDRETLRGLTQSVSHLVCPAEIVLPAVKRLTQNRGLATRGVDSRDIVLLSDDQASSLRILHLTKIVPLLRRYRSSAVHENKKDSVIEYALPVSDLRQLARSNTMAANLLKKRSLQRGEKARLLRRQSDLRKLWKRPPKGSSRFVIADGILPIKLTRLEAEEVPSQALFFVDGDAGVPALLQSRLFEVWARATMSRSTSWMSRFSISRTFETFPIVRPFTLTRLDDYPVVELHASDKRLLEIANEWQNEMGRTYKLDKLISRETTRRDLRRELDAAILHVYGLKRNVSDLDILERLMTTNICS